MYSVLNAYMKAVPEMDIIEAVNGLTSLEFEDVDRVAVPGLCLGSDHLNEFHRYFL